MSNETRPFEVGDMVVLDDNQTACVLDCSLRMVFVELCSGGQYHFYEHNIKTIRKPRKGSKEARDIVAMLAAEYRKALSAKKNNNESEFKRGVRCTNKFQKRIIYKKAKSMLK